MNYERPQFESFFLGYLLSLSKVERSLHEHRQLWRTTLGDVYLLPPLVGTFLKKWDEASDLHEYRHSGVVMACDDSPVAGMVVEIGVAPTLPHFRRHRRETGAESYAEYLIDIADSSADQIGQILKFESSADITEWISKVACIHVTYCLEDEKIRIGFAWHAAGQDPIMIAPEEVHTSL